ncbi:hypothetical protein NP233_g3673 [Leucocoprinus birnbaumii]|uniref:Transcription initiation factor TFIID subunit 2 n=1 Tax=Leucocoprinus birnbaumii TaxID=56174 RepID=A0AAD5VW43_9AGAR|nr:hypothetical protein NP233_g3673 [Leucocoprinus birnbaumii]
MDARISLQRENLTRFCVYTSHQKVVLEIDFNGSLWGYTEITIVPTSSELRSIHLHARQCTIHSVTVGGHHADFVHHDALANISSSGEPNDIHRHPELKRKIYSALQESDEGELSVAIPKDVSLKQTSHTNLLFNEGSTPEPSTPGISQSQTFPEFSPIIVNIAYSLRNPADGVEFVLPNDNYPYRVPHVYTTPSCPDAARCWVPCIDNLWEKCTWEFEFVVPRYLEEADDREEFDSSELSPTIVLCSGELVEQIAHPYNSNKTIFLFSQAAPTSIQHIAFAAGPFHLYSIPADVTADEVPGNSQPLMYAFCLPGQESFLKTSTSFLRSSMSFYVSEFGSYPFNSHKLVFVDQLPTQRFDSASLSIVSLDVLHGEDAIEQAMETRLTLSHALACQWVGVNIVPRTWSDIWLVNGLALYITGLFMRKMFGNNDYRFKLKKDMQRILEWDVGSMPPICQPQVLDPPDAVTLPFINLKAPLVLHILDRRLCKSGTSLGLSRVLPKLFLSAISGELPNSTLSTHAFLRMCRKVSGVDPRSFAEQWIYGSGCPSFGFSASFNRKKMAVEITMRQEAPAFKAMENNDVSKALMKPVDFFEGQMTIRIHEADGTPYEHVLDIRTPFKRYEVPFNTKYKRVRRNTKRYLARQAAAQAAAEGDAEAAEAMGMIDMGFGLEIWEKEQEREIWKVADWTEEDEAIMSGATYEWIRMDADFEWIANIKFDQPDFMWVSQLQRDRDVVAQLEALHALAEKPTAIVSSTLTKTVLVSNYYYRIRCEAANALVTCAIRKLDFLGLFHLFKLFLRYCYDPEDANQDLFTHNYVPKPNNFSDLAEYFVRKSLITAISRVRFENGKSPSVVRQFLIDQLRYNDNTSNPFSDGFYICTIISAAAYAAVSVAPPERGELLPSETRSEQTAEDKELTKQTIAEIDRYRSMDRLIPSPHNIVTIATLEFYMILGVANLIPSHPKVFFPLTREGHYTQVRLAAFDGLFLTKWYTPVMMRYILSVIANDSSRVVRRHVARNACHSLALLVQMGEMKTGLKDSESLLIEEDGNAPEKAKEAKKSELDVMIKILRKDREVGKNESLREFVMPIALAPDVDSEVRWCLLKLADLLVKPYEETPPSVKIHIPSTPIVEAAPPIPPVKVPVKPPRSTKSGGPPSRHPSIQLTVSTTKVKIPGSPRIPSIDEPIAPSPITKKAVSFATPAPPPASSSKGKVKPVVKPPAPKPVAKPNAKSVQVPRAQSSGMNLNDLRACRNALKKLQSNKHARLFNQPVDPIRDNAPRYFDVIKEPMDLRTMGAKLDAGMYKDRFGLQADFGLMVSNAKLYNTAGSYVHNEAIALETFFEKQWAIINKTLEAADKNHASQLAHETALKPVVQPAPSTQTSITLPASTPKQTHPTPSTSASSSRPTIKLKVGSQTKPSRSAGVTPSHTPPPPAVSKPRKSKAAQPVPVTLPEVEPPPPPYVDDGSHDILQEVLAIEREKDEERLRMHSERDKSLTHPNVSKRKKGEALDEEYDDILAMATPAKKERPSPPTPKPAAAPSEKPGSSMSITIPRAQPSKNVKKERSIDPRPSAPTPPVEIPPKPSHKGKERESVPQSSKGASPVPPTKAKKVPIVQATPINEKKCKDLLKTLQKIPEAGIFNLPVDPVVDGCPTYLDEIAYPMDFSTMGQKLADGRYATMEDFKKDVELIFSNCRQFNPPATFPVNCADVVERAFKREWPKAMERKLSWSEKRGLQAIMSTLAKDPVLWVFREPVDPELLGIPTYFEVIPKKDARDLRTIRQKLDNDKYDTVEAFEADLDLMIQNAIKFNGLESEVGRIAVQSQSKIQELLAGFRTGGTKKRKDSDKGTPQPSKKVKVG